MRFLLVRLHYGKSSFTWGEIGAFLKECWWLVALFFILFIPRAYLLHKEQKQMMEEQEEQERLRERYGEPAAKAEERPPYEDTYLHTPRSARVPDGEVPFGAPNYTGSRYEWRIFTSLLVSGFIIGSGGIGLSMDYLLMFLMLFGLMGVVIVMKHLGPGWMYTSFEEDKEKKQLAWGKIAKELLPYGAAFVIGLILGFVRLLMGR